MDFLWKRIAYCDGICYVDVTELATLTTPNLPIQAIGVRFFMIILLYDKIVSVGCAETFVSLQQ